MAINLPERRLSAAPQPRRRQVPVEQILDVMGNNPIGQSLSGIGKQLGEALMVSAERKKKQDQAAALGDLLGADKETFSRLSPEVATSIATSLYKHKQGVGSFSLQGTSEDGKNVLLMNNQTGEIVARPNPIGGPLAGKARDPYSDDRLALQKERLRKDVVDKFNKEAGIVKARSAVDAAYNVRALVDSNNPIAAGAVPTYMARASGEVGNLSEADKAPFGGSQAILTRLQAALTQKATGQLSTENAQFLTSLANTMETSAKRNIDRAARERARQYSRTGNYKEKDIYETLNPPETPGAQPIQSTSSQLSPEAQALIAKYRKGGR